MGAARVAGGRWVDIHSHLYPRSYLDMLRRRTELPRVSGEPGDERFVIFPDEDHPRGGRPIDAAYWDIGEKLAFMDRFGIGRTVLSLGNPWLDPFSREESRAAATALNAEFAALRKETAGRIVGLGVLPTADVTAAADTVETVAETPDLFGLVSSLRPCGLRLDDEALEPLWTALERRAVPLLLHPHYGSGGDELRGFGHALPVSVGFTFETTISVTRLVLAGVLHRHPGLVLVASHGGGTLPYLAGRLDAAWRSDPSLHERLPEPPSGCLSRLFLDTVLYHERAVRAAVDLVGTQHMAFGTDHPFSVADPEANIDAITAALAGAGLEDVVQAAANRLFGMD